MTIYSTDHEVVSTAVQWLQQGYDTALVTVAKTWGSSPRPRGSLLVMRGDGMYRGSVSGGCVEDDLVRRYTAGELSCHLPTSINYGVNRQDASRFGLPCGGRLELVVEQLVGVKPLELLLQKMDAGLSLSRRVCLRTGETSLHECTEAEFIYTEDQLSKCFGSQWHLLLIGAGQLSQYTSSIALMLGYKVTVCDPRDHVDVTGLNDVELVRCMPDDAVKSLDHRERSLVVTLTHDPKLDDMALMEALTMDLFYVGALGSRRSSEQRRNRLMQMDVRPDQLAKLHAPIGLAIGSHTPPEIAVAIMAQITAVRNGISQAMAHGSIG